MTAPRIITADEARVLREAATPGPWHVGRSALCDCLRPCMNVYAEHGEDVTRPCRSDVSEGDAPLLAAAPDLAATVEALYDRAEKAEANYAFVVDRAANQRLDGYRELGAKCAELEDRIEKLLRDRDAAYWSGYADGYGGGHTADTIRATVEALHAEVARLRALVREAYREGFSTSDEMGWHGDDSASETRWLASAARAALEVTP